MRMGDGTLEGSRARFGGNAEDPVTADLGSTQCPAFDLPPFLYHG